MVFLLDEISEMFDEFGAASYIILRVSFSVFQVAGAIFLVKKGLQAKGIYSMMATVSTLMIEVWFFWQVLFTNRDQIQERFIYILGLLYNFWYFLQIRRYKGWLAKSFKQ